MIHASKLPESYPVNRRLVEGEWYLSLDDLLTLMSLMATHMCDDDLHEPEGGVRWALEAIGDLKPGPAGRFPK